jgi:dsDNA-binding SOS-regulon protein
MGSKQDLKGVQRIMGFMASLNRFVSRLRERRIPLYKMLRKTDHFEWTIEAQEALDNLKKLLTRTPILASLEDKEPLLLYVAGTTQVVSLVLVVKRQEGEGIRPLQCPFYFVREVLTSVKTRYP